MITYPSKQEYDNSPSKAIKQRPIDITEYSVVNYASATNGVISKSNKAFDGVGYSKY